MRHAFTPLPVLFCSWSSLSLPAFKHCQPQPGGVSAMHAISRLILVFFFLLYLQWGRHVGTHMDRASCMQKSVTQYTFPWLATPNGLRLWATFLTPTVHFFKLLPPYHLQQATATHQYAARIIRGGACTHRPNGWKKATKAMVKKRRESTYYNHRAVPQIAFLSFLAHNLIDSIVFSHQFPAY